MPNGSAQLRIEAVEAALALSRIAPGACMMPAPASAFNPFSGESRSESVNENSHPQMAVNRRRDVASRTGIEPVLPP